MTRPTSNLPSQGRCIIIALSGATHERPGKNGEVNELIVYNTSALYDTFRSTPISSLYPLISVYISLRGGLSDSLLSRISTWKISNLHVDIFCFPRGRQKNPPKFQFILPKFYFVPTWRIFFFHVDISKSPRGNQFSPTRRQVDM